MVEVREEGWHQDPYELHEARWFSGGRPTKLVRDGSKGSSDEPPGGHPPHPPEPIESEGFQHGADLRRAGDSGPPGFDRAHAQHAGEAAAWEAHVPFPIN